MAETQTPIEALAQANRWYHELRHEGEFESCDVKPHCADAREALSQVKAVVKALRVAQELAERPDKVGFHEEEDFIVWQREANLSDRNARTALAPFTEKP